MFFEPRRDSKASIVVACFEEDTPAVARKLGKAIAQFHRCTSSNRNVSIIYRERRHYGEIIATPIGESTVNEVVSKRMAKKKHRRWTKQGAHLLLQVRVRTLNGDLRDTFRQWYPGKAPAEEDLAQAA